MEKKKDTRQRHWATVLYPESAAENWVDVLRDNVIPCFVSPLHDSDLTAANEVKKAHYHILFTFEGKKSKEQVERLVEELGSVGLESIHSVRGYARYLCHLDDPDKAQYSQDDVLQIGGTDYAYTIGRVADKYKAISEIIDFCRHSSIVSYAVLLEYCRDERQDWFRVLCDSGTVVVKEYLKSKSWTQHQSSKYPIAPIKRKPVNNDEQE